MLGSVVPCAVYGINGTKTLANNIAAAEQAFLGSHAILMKSHGAVCFGRDQDSAFRSAFALEDRARSRYAEITGAPAPAIYTPDEAADCGMISYHTGKNGTNVFVKTPVMKLASEAGRDIEIFIDDAAQLFGTRLRCLPENADQKLIFAELKRVPAVLIENQRRCLPRRQPLGSRGCLHGGREELPRGHALPCSKQGRSPVRAAAGI